MRWYYKLPLRLRSFFRKDKAELDLSEELQFHLQNQIDEFVGAGNESAGGSSCCPASARGKDPFHLADSLVGRL
jgi:hypothetical protein